jgi:hypothetical protein
MSIRAQNGTPSAEARIPEAGLVPRDITWLALSVNPLLDVLHELNHPGIEFVSFQITSIREAHRGEGESRNADGADQGSKARKEERTVGRRECSCRSRGIEGYSSSSFRRIRCGLMNETMRHFKWLDAWPCLAVDFAKIVSRILSP